MEPVYQQFKRQRNLILILFGILLLTFFILYFGYFKEKRPTPSFPQEVIFPERRVYIDFSIFQNPLLKELQPIEKIESATSGEIGRENPFLPPQ
jgi:hypothetical protein